MLRSFTPARLAVAVCAVAAGAFAGSASAAVGITLSSCGTANGGFQFTINGTGFTGVPGLNVEVTSSEPGAVPNPNYVVRAGAVNNGVFAIAELSPTGSFGFAFSAGSGQLLPATVTISPFDAETFVQGAPIFSTVVNRSTPCTDGSGLAGASSAMPTAKRECMAARWKTYGVFKNQGDCVSFVATREKNPPARLP